MIITELSSTDQWIRVRDLEPDDEAPVLALFAELTRRGITEVGVTVPDGWTPGRSFLTTLGFTFSPPRLPANANRNTVPGEGPVIPARRAL